MQAVVCEIRLKILIDDMCTHLAALLEQDLVVFAKRDTKDDGGDGFEAVDPFLAFASLTANVEHAVVSTVMRWRGGEMGFVAQKANVVKAGPRRRTGEKGAMSGWRRGRGSR